MTATSTGTHAVVSGTDPCVHVCGRAHPATVNSAHSIWVGFGLERMVVAMLVRCGVRIDD